MGILRNTMTVTASPANTKNEPITITDLRVRCIQEVYQYARRRVACLEDAEDVAAETFSAAMMTLGKIRGEDPRVWLLGIARRKVADKLRKRSRRPELSLQHASETPAVNGMPSQVMERNEAALKLRQLVDGLPEDQREALLLQYLEELSIKEIAGVMGKSPEAVNSLLQRARTRIYDEGRAYFLDTVEVQG